MLGVLALLTIALIVAGIAGINQIAKLEQQGPHPVPETQTLMAQMVVFENLPLLAESYLYPEDTDPDAEKALRTHIAKDPWIMVTRPQNYQSLRPDPDLESSQLYSEFYFNEDASAIAFAYGLLPSLPSVITNARLPLPYTDLENTDPAWLTKIARRRPEQEIIHAAEENEIYLHAISVESWLQDKTITETEAKEYRQELIQKVKEKHYSIPHHKGVILIIGTPVSEFEEQDLNAMYWRAYRRACAFSYIRGYAKNHDQAKPIGIYGYLINRLQNALYPDIPDSEQDVLHQ